MTQEPAQQENSGMCGHTRIGKEYLGGMDTGDLKCLTCGAVWMRGAKTPPPKPVRR